MAQDVEARNEAYEAAQKLEDFETNHGFLEVVEVEHFYENYPDEPPYNVCEAGVEVIVKMDDSVSYIYPLHNEARRHGLYLFDAGQGKEYDQEQDPEYMKLVFGVESDRASTEEAQEFDRNS